jgi:hypothetical protein
MGGDTSLDIVGRNKPVEVPDPEDSSTMEESVVTFSRQRRKEPLVGDLGSSPESVGRIRISARNFVFYLSHARPNTPVTGSRTPPGCWCSPFRRAWPPSLPPWGCDTLVESTDPEPLDLSRDQVHMEWETVVVTRKVDPERAHVILMLIPCIPVVHFLIFKGGGRIHHKGSMVLCPN